MSDIEKANRAFQERIKPLRKALLKQQQKLLLKEVGELTNRTLDPDEFGVITIDGKN